MLRELSDHGSEQIGDQRTIEENAAAVGRRFAEALEILKTTYSRQGERQYLYKLPWYIIIGPPGSGKTTALLNSGLKFPLADALQLNSIRGVSGTRHCDWFFTDEAILIDTAGRYATQDSHLTVDAAEWRSFLDLLKKYRPRQPVNGVLVTLSLPDLLKGSDDVAETAKAMRHRIQELYTALGNRFPLYMLFTKCDLVAGFTDCFADLSDEDRAQVWGETSQHREPEASQGFVDELGSIYEGLIRRLNRRCSRRIQEERDINRRALILNFPEQMGQYRKVLEDFMGQVFGANRYETTPFLRGVYFTSGTQEGTPIDRIMGILSSAYGFDRQSAPIYSGRGKSFFITRLLRDVIFHEAELAGLDPRVERKQKYLQWGALGSAATLAILSLMAWFASYNTNSNLIGRVEQEAIAYRDLKPETGTDWSTRWQAELNRLAPLQKARDIYKDAGLLAHFGLYQGDKVTQATEKAYQNELSQNFLPLLMQRTAQRMTGPEASKPEVLYELLRVYLMLSKPERMQTGLVRTWVTQDWEQGLRTQPNVLSDLTSHLDQLLTLEREPTPVDPVLVANARARLTEIPRVTQLYLRFKDEIPKSSVPDFKLSEVLGPEASQVFSTTDGKPITSIVVPALFTAQGYKELFLGKSLEFFKAAISDNWVLGQDATPSPTEFMRLYDDYRQLYLDEYRRVWSDLLAGLQPQPVQSLNQAIALLETLSKPNNPLVKLVEMVSLNTALSHVTQVSADAKPDDRTQHMLEAAKAQVPELGNQTAAEQHLEAAFAGLHGLVQKSGDQPPAMDALLQIIEKLHDYLLRVASFAGGGEQALKKAEERMAASGTDVIAEAKAVFSRLPEPLKSWLSPLATLGWKQVLSGARIELSAQLRTDVASPCMAALPGRYPFDPSGTRDMPLIEFGKLFGPNGVFDQFVATRLKGLVDTSGSTWKPIVVDNQSLGFSPTTLKQFQTFCKIRDAFFSAGGPLPRFAFELKPVSLDQRATSFKLTLEGQELLYQPGTETPMTLQWPGQMSGSGVKLVFLTEDGQEITNAKEGPWAFFKLLDESRLEATSQPERFNLTFQQNGYTAKYELRAGSALNPFNLNGLRGFNCPETL